MLKIKINKIPYLSYMHSRSKNIKREKNLEQIKERKHD